MMNIVDLKHDTDSCMDVWTKLYINVYPSFFGEYFDFSKIEDTETRINCKRWYIKLRNDLKQKELFPKLKMAGDCIFNFNHKKIKILKKYIRSEDGLDLLKYCAEHHHCLKNFAFMPITGGMNNQKGRNILDRPDIHVNEIYKYFKHEKTSIFSNARGNAGALKWYLSLFNENISLYIEKVYLIDDEDFIFNKFLPFSNIVVCDEKTAIQYMQLANSFWEKRNINLK